MTKPEKDLSRSKPLEGLPPGQEVAIVVSEYNQKITDRLLGGALECLLAKGFKEEKIRVYSVPGSFEIPSVCEALCRKGSVNGIITLGAVIRGETSHYDIVCREAARGIMKVSLQYGIPIAFGVLTCDTLAQAMARSGGDIGNKGHEAARALLDLLKLFQQIQAG